MRVICIDDFANEGASGGSLLKVGEIYTVIGQRICKHGLYKGELVYDLAELDPTNLQFLAKRFIPLSNIDELELVNNKKETVGV